MNAEVFHAENEGFSTPYSTVSTTNVPTQVEPRLFLKNKLSNT